MCEATAGRRITAARVCRKFPNVLARIASGELHLSAVCSMSPHLDWNNAPELIEACSNQSRRKVDEILAARFPRPDVREKVRLDPLSKDRYGLHFTIDAETLEELEQVRALARHRLPGGELSELFKMAMRALRADLEKQRFSSGRKKRGPSKPAPEASPNSDAAPIAAPPPAEVRERTASRRPSAEVARQVYARDEGQCTFVAADGRRCGARDFVEFDHIEPSAVGGEPTVENLRLRCRAHNQLYARQFYGNHHMATAVARARRKSAA